MSIVLPINAVSFLYDLLYVWSRSAVVGTMNLFLLAEKKIWRGGGRGERSIK